MRPANVGPDAEDIELTCKAELNTGDHWTSCSWSHALPDTWSVMNTPGYIMCTASPSDDGKQCTNVGNIESGQYSHDSEWLDAYVDRLTFKTKENECKLRISSPHANDTGLWICRMNDNTVSSQSTFREELNIFVANRSVVEITDPALEDGKDRSLWVDISDGQDKVQASCESTYGVPPPELVWYIDEPSNKVSSRDATIKETLNNPNDKQDLTVKSTILLELNERRLGSYGVRPEHGSFSFSLGCYPRQERYFKQDHTTYNEAKLMVFGTSPAQKILQSTSLLLAGFFVLKNL